MEFVIDYITEKDQADRLRADELIDEGKRLHIKVTNRIRQRRHRASALSLQPR